MNRRTLLGTLMAGGAEAWLPPDSPDLVEQSIFELVNRERRSRNLPELNWSTTLAAEARRHSERMERARFFSHNDPKRGSLDDRLRAADIRYRACAENLYRQSGLTDPASAAVKAWLQSSGHRANLLNRAYRGTGIGVAVAPEDQYIVTQIFVA
jgi:uncharacterized protein YkwD